MAELTVNQISEFTGKDRRTVKRRLEKLRPIRSEGRGVYYLSQDALAAVYDHAAENPTKEKARLDRLRADKLERELKVIDAELVSTPDIADAWKKIAVEIRTKMLAIPTKAAPLVFGAKRLTQVQKTIEKLIHDALTSIADGGAPVPRKPAPAKAADGKRVGGRKQKAEPRKQRRAGQVGD